MIRYNRSRRVLAAALAFVAFFFFCFSPLQQHASAVVVSSSFIGIIIAALAAMGITFAASGSFGDITEYVAGLLQEHAESRGLTVDQMFDGVQTGSNKLGDILLNNHFVILIETFARWIVNKFSLVDNDSQPLVTPGASINGMILYRLPIVLESKGGAVKDKGIRVITSEDDVFVAFGSSGNFLDANCISDGAATIQFGDLWTDGSWLPGAYDRTLSFNLTYNKYYYKERYTMSAFDVTPYYVFGQEAVEAALSGNVTSTGKQIDVTTGVISYPTDSPDYTANSGAILDVGGSWGETYDNLTDYQIPVGYADSTIAYQNESDVANQVTDTPAQSISQNVNDYQVPGLSGVFPFCIPFDIYNFLSCLAADPVAPSVSWRFYLPGLCDEQVEIDLSQFNTVAQIVRTMELLAFIVGLAFVTRSKFLRG